MTYMKYIENKILDYDFGVPIYTKNLSRSMAEDFHLTLRNASAAASVAVKRIMDDKIIDSLRFYQKGIYYRAKMTPFGETGIDKDSLISDKYLADDNGYESGHAVLHRMGLTTQIPAERCIVSNRASDCRRKDIKLDVFICPPKIKINAGNKRYLQTLDAIDTMSRAPVDAENPNCLLADYIKNAGLDFGKLLALASKYYNKNTVHKLAIVAEERIINETT